MNQLLATFKKNRIMGIRACPYSLIGQRIVEGIMNVIFPLMMYFYLFEGNLSEKFVNLTGTENYVSYVVIGNCVNILAMSTLMNVSRCMISEIREGTFDFFVLSPASRVAYYLGCYIEQFGRACFEYFIVCGIGVLCGARFSVKTIPLMLFFICFLSLICFTMAILLSSIMIFTKDTYVIQNTIFILMQFLCGINFPTEMLPPWLYPFAYICPLTKGLEIFRNCVINLEPLDVYFSDLISLLFMSSLYFVLGYVGYLKIEKKIVEQVII